MKGLFLKVNSSIHTNHPTIERSVRIDSFMLMEESTASQKHGIKMNVWNRIPEDKEPDFPGAKFKFLRCLSCQHEDFSENGYDLGIYTCNGCDTPVRISIRNTNLAKP